MDALYDHRRYGIRVSQVPSIKTVIYYAIISCCVIYLVVGLAGYHTFGPNTDIVILDNCKLFLCIIF
jgi:amino acid permease